MDGLGAVLAGGVEDAVDAQVAFGGRRRPDALGLIGHADVQRSAVGVGIDGHGGDPHFAQRAHHPHRDFPAVCDQDLTKHGQGEL